MEEEKDRQRKKIIAMLKSRRIIASIIFILIGLIPIATVLFVCFVAVERAMGNVFTSDTAVGGEVYYGATYDTLPDNITTNGIEKWTDKQRLFFDKSRDERTYYDQNFSRYNTFDIKSNSSEKYDITIPIATAHYRGTVDQLAYDQEFSEDEKYDNDVIVSDIKTRDFFEQAGERVGATFRMYPGNRMLMGNLVGNDIVFKPVQFIVYEDGTTNANEIYGDWRYLAKLNASTENDAIDNYNRRGDSKNVDYALKNTSNSANFGEKKCKSADDGPWLTENYCYDFMSVYSEVFGEKITKDGEELTPEKIVEYLEEQFKNFDGEHDALVPTSDVSLIDKHYYITADVSKKLNQDKYVDYLKSVYIPYLYLDCDTCGYQDEPEEVRAAFIESVYNDMKQFINTFKEFNMEDTYLDYVTDNNSGGSGGSGGSVSTPIITGNSYECGDGYVGIEADYGGHNGDDITSTNKNPLVYPLVSGTVIDIQTSCGNFSNRCSSSYTIYNSLIGTANSTLKKELQHYDGTPRSDASLYVVNKSKYSSMLPPVCTCGGGYGNRVKVQSTINGKTYVITYAHLDSVLVSNGPIDTSTPIGAMGNTGISTAQHLHIDVRIDGSGPKKPTSVGFSSSDVTGTACKRKVDGS